MKKRVMTSTLSILMMLQILAGCQSQETTDPEQTTGAPTESTAAEEPQRDFGGKPLRVYMATNYMYQMYADEANGDITNDAIYQRNITLEDKYNFTIEPIYFSSNINIYEPTSMRMVS